MLEISARLKPDAEPFDHVFPAGSLTVVLGPNESGKTNLCRLIAGLECTAEGSVRYQGEDLARLRTIERPVAMVYQAFVNYPNLTVEENIASPLRAQKRGAEEIRERVRDLAGRLQIEALLERMPDELSGGQQQRLAIARALAKNAEVILLDEPLVNLDFKLREALETELRDILLERGTTVIYTSSDPRDAFNLADEVLLLASGNKLQSGAPIDVYSTPVSLEAMMLLSDPGVNLFNRDERLFAVRPEHVTTVNSEGFRFSMGVTAYETNGDESFIHGVVEGNDWVLRQRGMMDVQAGQPLDLYAREQDVFTF